jgi:predicted nucleic acid-binding protein
MVFLDSCILIYLLEGNDAFSSRIAAAIQASQNQVFCANELVRFECLVGPLRSRNETLRSAYESYFDTVRILEMGREVFDEAAKIRAAHCLKTPDALHLATAIRHQCEEFWTGDTRFAALSNLVRVQVFGESS